ncbi:DUF4876 domain-containing protein [Chryseobacterium sp. CT-SW4]|uniref:DUF4876 domain-containing protein n=1 Tax=Chryseobacterium sp. SW-1 TaxID=3157343 RepID=UPI003B02ACFC
MKKHLFLFILSLVMVLTGCRDNDFENSNALEPVAFNVAVKYDANLGSLAAANVNVTLTNDATGDQIKGVTDSNGELKLTSILPGTYTIMADINLTKQKYYETFGFETNKDEVSFNGSQEKVSVNINVNSTTIVLANGVVSDFVIKQYYYAGSDTTLGALFRDQFIEIHNNSNEVLYADGLYIALLDGNTTNTSSSYTQSNGQYDWSLSTGNNIGSSANTDYVYASSIIKVPGSGTQYPIQPGASFIIAQTAINHKAPYTTNAGVNVPILDPSKTVDLSTAEFETYLGDWAIANGDTPYTYDIQNPAVPDMNIIYWNGTSKDLLLNTTSRPALVIFNGVTDTQISAYPKVPNPKDLTGKLYARIPKNIIMDGVDTTNKNLTAPKDLQNDVDAGRAYIQNSAGEAYADYTSYSVIRKTKTTINGRVVLQDTNNSTNDFVTIKANPKGYAE